MTGEGLRGVDVSQHQGSIQWERVRADGFRFAIVKCSEGQDFIDPADGGMGSSNDERLNRLRARCAEVRRRDLTLGVYHYLRPRPGRTGDVEADWAVRVARAIGWGKKGDLRLVVDVEETELGRFATQRYLGQFVRRVQQRVGHKPVIYTFPFFWSSLGNPKNFGCPLWIAHFEVDRPSVPGPWTQAAMWQHTSKGRVSGVGGDVDLNRTLAPLPLLGAATPEPQPDDDGQPTDGQTDLERLIARMRRARRKWLATGANQALRVYLMSKARLGRWDDRYCMFFGVDPQVTPDVRAYIARAYAAGLVPTSTTGGSHSPGSFHFQTIGGRGRAADIGLRSDLIGTARGLERMRKFQAREFANRAARHPVELIGPDNDLCVLNGVVSPLAEGSPLENQHDNHVHGAF
jgi:GH25 family lysozyme M1 (1,4-beta-N-acetylmuramidase)